LMGDEDVVHYNDDEDDNEDNEDDDDDDDDNDNATINCWKKLGRRI
jgi:hypothetical protein